MSWRLQRFLWPRRRPAGAPLRVATALTILISSADMPLHMLTQPTAPATPDWRGVVTALAVPARPVSANDVAPGGGATARASESDEQAATPDANARADGPLADARWRLYNGEPRAALAAFRSAADGGPPETRAEALYWVGYALLQLDERPAAQAALAELRERYPGSDAANAAVFLAGTLQRRAGQFDAALAQYRAYRASAVTAPYVQAEIASTLLEAGRSAEAADAAATLIAAEPGRILAVDAREIRAKAMTARGDHAAAAELYRQILERARTANYRAEINFRLGESLRAAGDTATAATAYAAAVRIAPASSFARQALDALDTVAPRAVTSYDRGLVRYRAYRYSEARRLFGQFLDEQPDHADVPNALFYLAATQEYTNDLDLALRNYDAVADRFPDSEKAPDALWYAGRLRESLDNPASAGRTYDRVATAYPSSVRAGSSRFRQGYLRHAARDYPAAIDIWSQLATQSPRPPVLSAALYWRGRAQRAAGDTASAAESVRLASLAAPYTYHGVRARVASTGTVFDGRFRDAAITGGPAPAEESATALAWLRAAQADAAPFALGEDAGWQAAVELGRVGLTARAGEVLQELLERLDRNGPALYQLAVGLRDEGQFRLSMAAATLALNSTGQPVEAAPRALRQLIYPAYFGPLILEASRNAGVDPLLLMGLVRQESSFDQRARSVADARGLTQVVPSTGQEIANALGVGFSAGDLYQAATSIRFGAYYLKTQLERYQWSPYRALTAYTAGGGNADRWSAAAGADEDLFYEAIDFDETRTYLDRVVPNWLAYQDLYR